MNQPRHWLTAAAPKAAPALATSTVLILARIWNANGAEHSTGDAWLMGTLAVGAAIAGAVTATGLHGGQTTSAVAFTASGALALAGVAGYADGLPLPLLLWAIATVMAYGLAAQLWRNDRCETVAYERHAADRREEHGHLERMEAMRCRTQVEVAREGTAYAAALAEALTAARAALPGFDLEVLTHAGLPALPKSEENHP